MPTAHIKSSSSSLSGSDGKDLVTVVERPEDNYDEKTGTHLYNPHIDTSGIDEAQLVKKLDRTLVPWLALLYLLSFLDRTSIGNAKVRDVPNAEKTCSEESAD